MSKKEIIDAMADAAEITKEKAGAALDALTGYIEGTLKSGEEVNFAPLGKFKVTDRAAREGRNPMSGEKIKIPASKSVIAAGRQQRLPVVGERRIVKYPRVHR